MILNRIVPKLCRSINFVKTFTALHMDSFLTESIVPEVIDKLPQELLTVKFGSKLLSPGEVFKPRQVKDKPELRFTHEAGSFYTVFMTDPDAPSRADPKFREWHHWMVVNVANGDVNSGEERSEYVGSGPPPETGLHRYVLLVYKQPGGKASFDAVPKLTNRSAEGRGKRPVREILKEMGMTDAPLVAGNFYLAEFDDYVPELYKQLGAA